MIPLFGSLLYSLPLAAATGPGQSVLTIKIENVSNEGGYVQIALYDQASFSGHDQTPVVAATVEAKAPETVVTLPGVRPGIYAIKMFQDVHRTGSFVTSKLGIPEEPYGFSNDARSLLDQPSFDAAKFNIANGWNQIVVHLRSQF